MFPDNRLSTTLVGSPYTFPYTLAPPNIRTAYASGGAQLYDAGAGLDFQLWTAEATEEGVYLTAPNQSTPILILAETGLSDLTLAFDQNMNPSLSYIQNSVAKFYWYDTFISDYVINTLPAGTISPRMTLDDRRELQSTASDVVLAYVRDNNLYFRLQRERYLTERLLASGVNGKLVQMGMNTKNRLQFKIKLFRTS